MASPLGALLEALGQGGMNIAQFKVKEKNDALARALEEARFKETAELNRRQLEQQQVQFEMQNADREEGRRLQREAREQAGAQFGVANFGGQRVSPEQAALYEKYIPGSIAQGTDIKDVAGHEPINGLPVSQAFEQTNTIRETQPASLRAKLADLEVKAAQNQALNAYRAQRVQIDNARTELMRQRQSLSEQEFALKEQYLDLARQKAEDDFNQTNARIEASIYNTDSRADLGNDFMSSFLSGLPGGSGLPAGPAKPPAAPPKRPTVPTRSGGGGTSSPSIDDLFNGLSEYIRRGSGGR